MLNIDERGGEQAVAVDVRRVALHGLTRIRVIASVCDTHDTLPLQVDFV